MNVWAAHFVSDAVEALVLWSCFALAVTVVVCEEICSYLLDEEVA